jgi:hypothetical protein
MKYLYLRYYQGTSRGDVDYPAFLELIEPEKFKPNSWALPLSILVVPEDFSPLSEIQKAAWFNRLAQCYLIDPHLGPSLSSSNLPIYYNGKTIG